MQAYIAIQQRRYALGAEAVDLDYLAAARGTRNESHVPPVDTQSFGEESEQLLVSRLIDRR